MSKWGELGFSLQLYSLNSFFFFFWALHFADGPWCWEANVVLTAYTLAHFTEWVWTCVFFLCVCLFYIVDKRWLQIDSNFIRIEPSLVAECAHGEDAAGTTSIMFGPASHRELLQTVCASCLLVYVSPHMAAPEINRQTERLCQTPNIW